MRIVILLFFLSSFGVGNLAAQVTGLGAFDSDPPRSRAWGISSDGLTVVGSSYSAADSANEGFRWTESNGMEGTVAFFFEAAYGVSDNGQVLAGGGFGSNGGIEAMRWTKSGGREGLGDLDGGSFFSYASDISTDGQWIVGRSNSSSGQEAFVWTAGNGMVGIGDLAGGSFESRANAISGNAAFIAGEGQSGSGVEAFRWSSSQGMVGLGDLAGGSFESRAKGISFDGTVIVGESKSDEGTEAFLWTAGGGMTGLGDLAGGMFHSSATDVSDDGAVVVGFSQTDDHDIFDRAFVWTSASGMVSLYDALDQQGHDLTHWTSLNQANAISADGTKIAGWGINSSGNQEAFIATFSAVPEPTSTSILLTLCLIAAGHRRRRSRLLIK